MGVVVGILLQVLCTTVDAQGQPAPDAIWRPWSCVSADSAASQARTLERRLEADPGKAELWLQLGHAHLRAGNLKKARKAFRKAETTARKDGRLLAQAYNGLGLVSAADDRGLLEAVAFYKKALSRDPRNPDILYNMALAYYEHDWLSHVVDKAEHVLAVDSTYQEALNLIDRCATRSGDPEKARAAYDKYLKIKPEDRAAWLEWGKLALERGDHENILARLVPVVRITPEWPELYPIVAKAYWNTGWHENAWTLFNLYLRTLDEPERALYTDYSLATTAEMAEGFREATRASRNTMARRFWAEHDPDYTTDVNERLLEHYRRIWYARTFFSEYRYPWDRRGEVYIRYGEPDHRSRSSQPSLPPSASVNAVKEWHINMLYGDEYTILAMGGGSSTRDLVGKTEQGTATGVDSFDAVAGARTGALVGPVYPIRSIGGGVTVYLPVGSTDLSLVKWESWVYTKVDGGIVIDFTDESGIGGFDYAPIPPEERTPGLRETSATRKLAALVRRSPKVRVRQAVSVMPEHYEAKLDEMLLGFYSDYARFRGTDPSIGHVEVYLGVPISAATFFGDEDLTGLRAECTIALTAATGGGWWATNELVDLEDGNRAQTHGLIPHTASIDVPPGDYLLDVRLRNVADGRAGSHRWRLRVAPYPPDSLRLSDIQLASKVTERGDPDKFTKNGLQVVPMPIRLYTRGKPAYLYYEIYNLVRDEFGMTSYAVEYTVRSEKSGGTIRRLLRALKGRDEREQVSVGTREQVGTRETEPSFVELDLTHVPPGKVVLTVTVTDRVSGHSVSREKRLELVDGDLGMPIGVESQVGKGSTFMVKIPADYDTNSGDW